MEIAHSEVLKQMRLVVVGIDNDNEVLATEERDPVDVYSFSKREINGDHQGLRVGCILNWEVRYDTTRGGQKSRVSEVCIGT